MNRLLACTAVGLFLGLAPAMAESQLPSGAAQDEPALQQPAQPSEATPANPSADAATPPAPSSEQPLPQAQSEAPKSVLPQQSADASPETSPFLIKQGSSDWLVGNLIGETVMNAKNESIGEITDLITDPHGKIVAVLIGAGGFLGIGEKDVAIRFEDVKVVRDENNDLKVMTNIDQQTLASAPDYQTLDEQQITVGEKGDRENSTQ
jgi:sporulation protein YlmC with PRC-barrel domain